MALKTNGNKAVVNGIPTAEELREKLAAESNTSARQALAYLFDEDTFVEIGTYVKRSYHELASSGHDEEFEGVITGYGSIDGNLVFAFAQDDSRMLGAIDEKHVSKIINLYELALKKSAPVIGIFASSGAFVVEGASALAAYGRLFKVVNEAGCHIPQIAYVLGNCVGTAAAIAASFDFVIANKDATFYVSSPDLGGKKIGHDIVTFTGDAVSCPNFIRSLLAFLPETALESDVCEDDINRRIGSLEGLSANGILSLLADGGNYISIGDENVAGVITAFMSIAGVKCGVVASDYLVDNGAITTAGANKIVSFLDLCDAYSLPVVTLVDSCGLAKDLGVDAIKNLALAYSTLEVPNVTVVLRHAIGAAFTLMGSKSLGADLVYVLDSAEVGVLSSDSAVAFAWNDQVESQASREELENRWRTSLSTPVAAASTGEIDDIIADAELRARVASALLMLTC